MYVLDVRKLCVEVVNLFFFNSENIKFSKVLNYMYSYDV